MKHQANKYMWSLIRQLANQRGVEDIAIYKQALKANKNYKFVLVQEKDANDFIIEWSQHGSGWMAEKAAEKENGIVIKCYKGVSFFSDEEQKQLIETIQEECKRCGVETLTPQEVDELMRGTHND